MIFVLLCSLHLFLYSRLPEGRTDGGWPTIVMNNWHEYGYWQLHGQLVANPGGLDSGEAQFIYPGHRPFFLIIPYLLKELPGSAWGDGLLYDFFVVATAFAALLWLFGINFRGLLIACAVCLAPGFFNNATNVDTIAVPALFGIAALSFVAGVLTRGESKLSLKLAAGVVLVLYMLQNWSTLFPLGVAAVYVLCKRPDWQKTVAYFGLALLVGVAVLFVSMHSRHANASNSGDFWNAYLWGPKGYDNAGMNLGKAFVRIMAVNTIAWLSLTVAGLSILLVNGCGERWKHAIWPLLAGIAAVFCLRNYNAHHPWNAVCEIGLGLVFCLELLTGPKIVADAGWRLVVPVAALAFSIVYLLAWQALDEFNGRDQAAVRMLVVDHTPRHAMVIVADGMLPARVKDLAPFAEEFDRKLVGFDEWNHNGDTLDPHRETFLLAYTTVVPRTTFVAQSILKPIWADKVMVPLFDFYRTKISRRAPGNRRQYFDEYKLYQFQTDSNP